MSSYVVWLDQEQAKLFKLIGAATAGENMSKTEIKHHTHGDTENHKNSEKFFHEVAHRLEGAKEVLLIGPGLAKTHFKSHLEKHHHSDLAKKIVGVETVDHPTEQQILAHARKFFKAYDALH